MKAKNSALEASLFGIGVGFQVSWVWMLYDWRTDNGTSASYALDLFLGLIGLTCLLLYWRKTR